MDTYKPSCPLGGFLSLLLTRVMTGATLKFIFNLIVSFLGGLGDEVPRVEFSFCGFFFFLILGGRLFRNFLPVSLLRVPEGLLWPARAVLSV